MGMGRGVERAREGRATHARRRGRGAPIAMGASPLSSSHGVLVAAAPILVRGAAGALEGDQLRVGLATPAQASPKASGRQGAATKT